MNLIPNWRQATAMWSVRLSLVSGIISATAVGVITAYAMLPGDWLPAVGPTFKATVAYAALISGGATAFAAAVARVIAQPKLHQ